MWNVMIKGTYFQNCEMLDNPSLPGQPEPKRTICCISMATKSVILRAAQVRLLTIGLIFVSLITLSVARVPVKDQGSHERLSGQTHPPGGLATSPPLGNSMEESSGEVIDTEIEREYLQNTIKPRFPPGQKTVGSKADSVQPVFITDSKDPQHFQNTAKPGYTSESVSSQDGQSQFLTPETRGYQSWESTADRLQTNQWVTDKLDIPEEKDSLQHLVTSLHSQLKEAQTVQARTRSILTVIEEKQLAQDQDLAFLKDELASLRQEREQDKEMVTAMRSLVADNAWSVSDIKLSQDRLRQDYLAFKQLQESHNETIQQVDELLVKNHEDHQRYHEAIRHMQGEMLYVRSSAEENRENLHLLENIISGKEGPQPGEGRVDGDKKSNATPKNKSNTTKHRQPNIISRSDEMRNEESEYSGIGPGNIDAIVSSLEEKDNQVEHNIKEILRNEDEMRQDMKDINERFQEHEGEVSKIYVMFYNLSLQVSTMENRLLLNQQKQFEMDLTNLQHSFMNFTHQIFHLEQWHNHNQGVLNTSSENRAEISNLTKSLDSQMNRIQLLEQLMLEQRTETEYNLIDYKDQIKQMNRTLWIVHKFLSEHNVKASNVFVDVDEKLADYNTRIKQNDERLMRVEVRVLDASLGQCEKGNSDILQDNKLTDIDKQQGRLGKKVGQFGEQITQMDKGLSRLHQQQEHGMALVNSMLDQMKVVLDILPNINTVQTEVTHLISQLPKDCSELLYTSNHHVNGPYLLKTEKADHSTQAYCEFCEDGVWTVIQRRGGGEESFARTWEEYKYGFGDPDKEYWIGNDDLHYITRQGDYELLINMWDLDDIYYWAQYDMFSVDEETTNYRLHVDGYKGNATDALKYSNFMPFSTMDQDNDVSSTHCAKFYTAGWWYKHCHYANLNGRYTVGVVWFNGDADEWMQMRKTEMKIRPINGTLWNV